MKKAIIIFILIISESVYVSAETLLLCISDNNSVNSNTELSDWEKSVCHAFEDGVMNAAFDAGLIVTNSYINECSKIAESNSGNKSDVASIMANKIGADFVVFLHIIFPEGNGSSELPEVLEYSLFDQAGHVLIDSISNKPDYGSIKGKSLMLDACSENGSRIASKILSKIP
ncbi:MAG: hypothetical protein PQJ46_03415 [Spirochaetales bacterium]|nr:hypothetical protein [Spirochaetales bacterium]